MLLRNKYISLLDYDHFEIDIMFNPDIVDFGISLGSTSFKGNKIDNLFVDFKFLFFTLGMEIKNLRK